MLIGQWFISHLVLFLSDTVGAVWKSSNKICSHWLSSWQGAAGILPLTGNWHFDSVSASRFIRWANPAGTMSGIDGRRQVVIDTGANRTSCWPLWLPVRLFKTEVWLDTLLDSLCVAEMEVIRQKSVWVIETRLEREEEIRREFE